VLGTKTTISQLSVHVQWWQTGTTNNKAATTEKEKI